MLPAIKKQIISLMQAALAQIAKERSILDALPEPHVERPKVVEHFPTACRIGDTIRFDAFKYANGFDDQSEAGRWAFEAAYGRYFRLRERRQRIQRRHLRIRHREQRSRSRHVQKRSDRRREKDGRWRQRRKLHVQRGQ